MLNKLVQWWQQPLAGPDGTDVNEAVRRATAALMIEISRSDADVSPVEQDTITNLVKSRFGLSAEALATLLDDADEAVDHAVSLVDFSRVLVDQLDTAERGKVVDMLWEVALADGSVDRYEDFYIRKVADLLYVSHDRFIQGKLRARGEL